MADRARTFALNETGAWIWEHIGEADSVKELAEQFIREADPDVSLKEIERDFTSCLQQMEEDGLLSGRELPGLREPVFCTISIAGLLTELRGAASFFSEDFAAFKASPGVPAGPDQVITVTESPAPACPDARLVLENEELCVLDAADSWELVYPSSRVISKTLVTKDGRRAAVFLKALRSGSPVQDVFHAIRLPFLLLAKSRGLYALHSASIEYKGRAFLFSAPSGTGKSTHVSLWEKAGWARVLNGDLNLIGFRDGNPYVYGMPWCGTSGIFTKKTVPLGGIILLKRGKQSHSGPVSLAQASLRTCQRLITPVWTKQMLEDNLSFCGELTAHVPVWELSSTPDMSAAIIMKQQIDSYESEK